MPNDESSINSIDRALKILEVLYESRNEMGVSEIASQMGLYKSTVFRTLSTLQNKGYVYQNKNSDKFGLGIRLYALGLAVKDRLSESIKNLLDPIAIRLLEQYHEVFNYSVPDLTEKFPQQRLIYNFQPSGNILTYSLNVGDVSRSHCSSAGKALLAYADEAYLNSIRGCELKKYTQNTITDWNLLLTELETIRQRGYSIDNEEQEIGLFCVAVPVKIGGSNSAAISLSGPIARMKSYDINNMVSSLRKTAAEISQKMILI